MRSRYFSFLFLLTTVCFLNWFETDAQSIGDRNRASATGGGSGSHTISGKVFLPDGTPAGGVKVTMNGGGFASGGTITDRNGTFAFGSMPKGSYSFQVEADGYQIESDLLTIERFATVSQGYTLIFHLRLPGQPKGAKAPANPLLNDVPKEPRGKYENAMEKIAKNDAKGALALLDEALALHPNFAAAYYEKGSAHLKENNLDKALESFVKAIQIKPDYLEAKYSFGYTQYLKKNYEVAAAVFEDVLTQKPDRPEAHLNLGVSLFYLKNIDAAESELKKALAAKGGESLALAHLYLGQIYAGKKRNAEAAIELQKYLDLAPKAPNAGRIKTVIADLKKAI
jgi:TolA-binding protein